MAVGSEVVSGGRLGHRIHVAILVVHYNLWRMKQDSVETAILVAGLARRIRDLEAVFSCGGTVTLAAPVTLRFGDGRRIRVERERVLSRSVGRRLMARCEPAPFGVGRETHRDRRVRDGGHLLARDGALLVSGLDLEETGILGEIGRSLCPQDPGRPAAELYALNVYGRGGHFVAHKDTPRDIDVFGTLVVCLPVHFRGGSLVLRHGSTRRCAWETSGDFGFGGQKETYPVHWAAFYSDVTHEIERVTDGTRVTLTWVLRRAAPMQPPLRRRPASSGADLEAAFAAALANPRFLPSGGILGVPCTHLYTATSRRSPFAETLSEPQASVLKGRDRLVANAALGAGLLARVRPYLFETCGDESWRLERLPIDRELRIFQAQRLKASRLEDVMPIEHHVDWHSGDDVTWITAPPWERSETAEPSADAEPASAFLSEIEYSATNYFGNEGGYAAFYVSAAILIDVPPARARTGKKAARSRTRAAAGSPPAARRGAGKGTRAGT
jgi:hypothetical protein